MLYELSIYENIHHKTYFLLKCFLNNPLFHSVSYDFPSCCFTSDKMTSILWWQLYPSLLDFPLSVFLNPYAFYAWVHSSPSITSKVLWNTNQLHFHRRIQKILTGGPRSIGSTVTHSARASCGFQEGKWKCLAGSSRGSLTVGVPSSHRGGDAWPLWPRLLIRLWFLCLLFFWVTTRWSPRHLTVITCIPVEPRIKHLQQIERRQFRCHFAPPR